MKTIPLLLSVLGLAFAGVEPLFTEAPLVGQTQSTQTQSTLTKRTTKQILFDFRVERRSGLPRIPLATQRNVLAKVFRKYLTDESKCNPQFDASGSNDPLKAARNAGQIVPSILDMATGSFTGPLLAQTAYVISVGECGASHADNFGTKRIAIFSGAQLIADLDVDFKSSIVRKTDLNGDGIDELLMATGDMNQGVLIEIAALLGFQNGRLRVIEDLGTVTEDACASLSPGSSARASVVSFTDVAAGKMPRFRIENYESGCGRRKRWRFISTGKMT